MMMMIGNGSKTKRATHWGDSDLMRCGLIKMMDLGIFPQIQI